MEERFGLTASSWPDTKSTIAACRGQNSSIKWGGGGGGGGIGRTPPGLSP